LSFIKNVSTGNQYIPRNSKKYVGEYPIVIRSDWERAFCRWLDMNSFVVEWKAEPVGISYFDPVLNKNRRYYVDFLISMRDKNNKIENYLIEIKPHKEIIPPKFGKKDTKKTKIWKQATYITNQAKFKAAEIYCRKMGYHWKILTEKQLFKK
jgi:hypothetical protein